MSARDRIGQVLEQWFLREPLLFAVWTTHKLILEPRIQTIRVRQGSIEYNPAFIDSLDKGQLDRVLRFEAMRILLKHPYTRRKENAPLAYQASNITLQEYLRTTLPFPLARDVFGTTEFDQQFFEFYYHKLASAWSQERQDAAAGQPLADQNLSQTAYAASAETEFPSDQDDQGPSAYERDEDDGMADGSGESPPDMGGEQTQGQGALTSQGGQTDVPASKCLSQSDKPSAAQDELSSDGGTGRHPDGDGQSPPLATARGPLEQYADPEQSGRENTQDWDADELMDDRLNEQIRNAQENNSWGSIAGSLRERIIASLKPKLDYRGVLRQFRTSILSVNRVLTRMKPSRRYGFLYMGSRRDFTTHLLFAVDVSGSVSSDDLARGFSVINRFFKYGIESIDVIQFDTEIKGPPLALKKAQREVKVLGRGGTSFIPVIDYIDEHRHYDGLIIFTDGYAPIPPKPKNRRTRVLWLFNHESNYERIHKELRVIGRAAFLKEDRR